jgi:small nuclear ribonucleoprotein (snRNP)-like protein
MVLKDVVEYRADEEIELKTMLLNGSNVAMLIPGAD